VFERAIAREPPVVRAQRINLNPEPPPGR